MDRVISASEAKQHFSKLLPEVAEGKTFAVVRRRYPVARIVPVDRDQGQRSIEQLLVFVAGLPLRHSGDWSRDDLYRR